MTEPEYSPRELLSTRFANALAAINACPGRYHTSVLNQAVLVAEVGFTDGWTVDINHHDRRFMFSYNYPNFQTDDDEIWWGCHQDVCGCMVRANWYGTHRLILPPATLNLDQAELYTVLRRDGMTPTEAHDIALLL